MHADDFRQDRYGVVSRLRDGGYSDDMTLAAIAGNVLFKELCRFYYYISIEFCQEISLKSTENKILCVCVQELLMMYGRMVLFSIWNLQLYLTFCVLFKCILTAWNFHVNN